MAEEITAESLSSVDIKKLALNKEKFGPLTFDSSYSQLEGLQTLLKEFDDLGYRDNLTEPEVNEIGGWKNQFADHLRRIETFDIGQQDSRAARDQLEAEIKNFYQSVMQASRAKVIYLRGQSVLASKDEKELQKQREEALKARKEYREARDQFQHYLKELEERQKKVEAKHGEIAEYKFATHFDKQVKKYSAEANRWLSQRNILFGILALIIGVNFLLYVGIFLANKFGWIALVTGEVFTIEYGIIKIAALSLLWYGINFASKNYNINSNLVAINEHRRTVAETLVDLLASNPEDKEARSKMIEQSVDAMFRHLPVGYIGKSEPRDNSPIHEIINIIKSNKGSTDL